MTGPQPSAVRRAAGNLLAWFAALAGALAVAAIPLIAGPEPRPWGALLLFFVYGVAFAAPAFLAVRVRDEQYRAMFLAAGLGMTVTFMVMGLLSGFILYMLPAFTLWLTALLVGTRPPRPALSIAAGVMWGFGAAALPAIARLFHHLLR